ncbi:MAG: CoA-acylating methylmalonate-semialdehyde dehydrogenase [Microbacteriaceae bacterium]|nr:CoA-acylating methylmalonate-semialdehyde dehydrogenase [Microbacteriaceae bacterium]
MTETLVHYINGAAHDGGSTRTSPVFNPATGAVAKNVRLANVADVGTAVAAATAAYPAWRDMSQANRQAILYRYRELLNARRNDLADILTAEHGKVTSDARGEVARGIEVVEFALGMPHLVKGDFSENVSTGVDVYTLRQPLGAVAIISPFNFPAMVPMWFFPIAIAAGNTVVLKPSEKDPSAANWMAELFTEAGLPDGVFNVVHGDKESVDALLEHPDIKAVSFVGSTPIAKYIYETASKHGKRVQALGGAKNHMLVLPDADLDLTADAAVNAGFGSAGERCMAISVVVAVEPVADDLIAKITDRMKGLKVGDGMRNCDMGPLITEAHRDKVASYIDLAHKDGATVVVDGRGIEVDGESAGFWLGPTLLDKVSTDSDVYQHEIFGPIVAIIRVASYEEGVALINRSPYGNGTAIFTNDGGAARRYQHEVQVGMVGVNVPIPVPVAYHSFGGWKDSAFGDAKAYGPSGVAFYTREKVVTARWLDPSHGGINLGFPQNQ